MQIIEISEPSKKEQADEIVVGIDFGTTNSLIAYSENGLPQIITSKDGVRMLPSVIAHDNNKFIVGDEAIRHDKHLRSIKRLLAKSSKEIKELLKYSDIADDFNFSTNQVLFKTSSKNYTTVELASEIFLKLRSWISEKYDKYEIKAVVSVPAYFDGAARGEVIKAAKLADIEVLRLMAEPTAAAYAYELNQANEGAYLVYDLGGGTFDVSILDMQEGVLQVIATGGDNMLGGDDLDEVLARLIESKLDKSISQELLCLAKEVKEHLTDNNEYIIDIDDKKLIITKKEFEDSIKSLIDSTIDIARDTWGEADNIKLSGIILVGGSTRIPYIVSRLESEFAINIYNGHNPDEIVALGAAKQAENLMSKGGSLLIDVLPLSIGLELYGAIAEKIILKNTPIPFSITKEFTTHSDNQTGMKFHIIQGEREMANDCRSLAHFELKNIPLMKAGRAKIKVSFAIDADGILSITAQESTSSNIQNILIKPSFGLSEEKIHQSLKAAYENVESDHKKRLLIETKEQANEIISGIRKAILETPDVLSEKEGLEIQNAINSLQTLLNQDNRDEIIKQANKLNELAKNFIQKHLNVGAECFLKGKNIIDIN